MKIILLVTLILNQWIGYVELFELTQLDSSHLFSFFTKSNNNLNNFKTKSPLPSDTSSDLIRQIPVYFEEQCALECLRNVFCARYSYLIDIQQKQPVCSIYLRSSFIRPTIETNDNNKLKESLNCNLQSCSNGVYCASSTISDKTNDGTCLCDVISSRGTCDDKISSDIKYELAAWSEWSNCSSSCGEGFKSRDRKCLKRYLDRIRNVSVVEEVSNQDWLCTSNLNDLFQIETCNMGDCSVFTQWTSWSKCDRLCNGFKSRSRSCTENSDPKLCNPNYLTETQLCSSFEDCNQSYLKIKSEGATVANITNKGIISLYDWKKSTERRLFTQTDDRNLIRSISVVACREFGFNRSVNAVANPVRQSLTQKYTDNTEYLKYVNENNINGVNCTGNEVAIKDCQASSDAKLETELYEVEVECLFNAYWSTWSSWTPCSVTCGAGARTRIRTCNDPPPSVSQFGNGDSCPAGATDFASCIMPRCKV